MKQKRAFTIVEVVLVLAIAGLIFMAIFIALPALQRSQRNTQRKNDIARILSAVTDYQTNNNGLNPFVPISDNKTETGRKRVSDFIQEYVDPECNDATLSTSNIHANVNLIRPSSCGSKFTDPDGEPYGIDARGNRWTCGSNCTRQAVALFDEDFNYTGNDVTHYIVVFTQAKCDAEEGYVHWTRSERDVAMWYRLEGGSIACIDNQ